MLQFIQLLLEVDDIEGELLDLLQEQAVHLAEVDFFIMLILNLLTVIYVFYCATPSPCRKNWISRFRRQAGDMHMGMLPAARKSRNPVALS